MLLDPVVKALGSSSGDALLQPFDFATDRQNQMLFFIKPEVFLLPPAQAEKTIRLISSCLEAFEIEVGGLMMMSAATLESRQIMDRHYGYINAVSRTASTMFTAEDQSAARALCEVPAGTPILGGHEVLQRFPTFSASSLDELWATKKSKRLRSGLYLETFDFDGSTTVIANGFHPYQLEHFTASGRKICLVLLNSDLPWRTLRAKMLGDTFPERAATGSIRGDLCRQASDYGFESVTIANNCAHMSAGPFEAAFELKNFLSNEVGFALNSTNLFRHFQQQALNVHDLDAAIANPILGGALSGATLFDASEECDASSSTTTYAQFRARI